MMEEGFARMWERRLSADSTFCRALVGCGYLTEAQMQRAAWRYRLGRSRDGGVIFWQIDEQQRIRDGKIMYYHSDCHRDKHHNPTWISALLKQHYGYPYDIAIDRCLFGLHLLAEVDGDVAVVEAEKTAVICSELYPQYLWLAAGGLSMLTVEKLLPLKGHKVILFPDTDPDGTTFTRWRDIAVEASRHFLSPVYVSPLLEEQATPEQKQQKIDLVDFLF